MITALLIWIGLGALGSVIMSVEFNREIGLPITLADFTIGARFALLGPINLAAAIYLVVINRRAG